MLFKEIIAVYTGNHKKPINTLGAKRVIVIVKAYGTYNYRKALKG
jgi:hypothetical protein